jgi:hypothetical protein
MPGLGPHLRAYPIGRAPDTAVTQPDPAASPAGKALSSFTKVHAGNEWPTQAIATTAARTHISQLTDAAVHEEIHTGRNAEPPAIATQ